MERTNDLLAYLGAVVEENTEHYKEDFEYDKEDLRAAAKEPKLEDRTFYFMSRPSGTWCVNERLAFLRDVGAHNIWTHYDYDNGKIKAFRVVVTGEADGKLQGEVYPLNYAEQMKRVEAAALPIHHVSGVYQDGESFSMSYEDFKKIETKLLIAKHGGMRQTRYEPENEAELQARIMQEHYIQTHPRRKTQKRKPPTR